MNRASNLTSKQVETLIVLDPNILVEVNGFSSGTEDTVTSYKTVQEQDSKITITPVFARRIESLDLSTPAKSVLKDAKIDYLGGLVRVTERDLLRMPNFDREVLDEIKTVLAPMGLRLGMNVDWPLDQEQEKKLVKKLNDIAQWNKLTLREIQVLRMQFGIEEKRHSLKEIAQIFSLSVAKIGYMQKTALQKLYRFGIFTGQITDVDWVSDLIPEQIEMLIKTLDSEMLVDDNQCPSAWK